MPSVAREEDPRECVRIMELRAYARAKQVVEQTTKLDDLPDDPMIAMVQEIQFEIAKEASAKRKAGKRGRS